MQQQLLINRNLSVKFMLFTYFCGIIFSHFFLRLGKSLWMLQLFVVKTCGIHYNRKQLLPFLRIDVQLFTLVFFTYTIPKLPNAHNSYIRCNILKSEHSLNPPMFSVHRPKEKSTVFFMFLFFVLFFVAVFLLGLPVAYCSNAFLQIQKVKNDYQRRYTKSQTYRKCKSNNLYQLNIQMNVRWRSNENISLNEKQQQQKTDYFFHFWFIKGCIQSFP